MELFQKKFGPVFLKEDSEVEIFIDKMTELSKKVDGRIKEEIDKQIKFATYGLEGEKNIAFELKNSDIDMYILHDVYFEYENLSAQIDYMIFTRKRVYIIECKNLIGDIEIDNGGNFIRSYELFGKKIKEGLYSPITQNERHRLVVKNIRKKEKNMLSKLFFDKAFEDNYKSFVVLANPKTVLRDRFAKKEVKSKVIRADKLVEYIKEKDREVTDINYSNDDMLKLATFFLDKSLKNKSDYTKKYESMVEELKSNGDKDRMCKVCGGKMVLRTERKGNNVGKQFWGCERFPECRYVENARRTE